MIRRNLVMMLIAIGLSLAACSTGPSETEPPPPEQALAVVDGLEVQYLDSDPPGVQIVARGNLPDGCTQLGSVQVDQSGNSFQVTIETVRPAELVCTMVLVPYEKIIPLDVSDLEPGSYTVEVNEASTAFEVAPRDPEPTPMPADPATGSIRGFVWHDLCGFAEGADGEIVDETPGCVSAGSGGFVADGSYDPAEPFVEGIQVSLSEGTCPQFTTLKSVTSEDGEFSFSGLTAGTYCVFIDPLLEENRAALMPGNWTFPDVGVGWYEVGLEITEAVDDLRFGWDYEVLPPVNFEGCVDNGQYIRDVTIPDGTVLRPGEVFTKTWDIRNIGTCHWVDGYSLVHAAGDRLSGENINLPVVLAGEEAQVSVVLTAPDVEGEFRGDWQLENAAGERFGRVGDFDLTLFLQITVEAAEVATPAIRGVVWDDLCDPDDGAGCVEDADGNLIANGELDEGEVGIEEVWVNLYEGTCASRGDSIDSSVSDAEGNYLFDGLAAGIYCVAVDELATENLPILGDGIWTHPSLNVSTINVTLTVDELREGIDFGWYFSPGQ